MLKSVKQISSKCMKMKIKEGGKRMNELINYLGFFALTFGCLFIWLFLSLFRMQHSIWAIKYLVITVCGLAILLGLGRWLFNATVEWSCALPVIVHTWIYVDCEIAMRVNMVEKFKENE